MGNATTIDYLIESYAEKLGTPVGITAADSDRTPGGFPAFLEAVASRLSPTDQTSDWLTDTANSLRDLDDLTPQARARRLRNADTALWDAAAELANH